MLGTTKPPYTLALVRGAAARARAARSASSISRRPARSVRRPHRAARRRAASGRRSSCFRARRRRSTPTSPRWPGSRRATARRSFCFGPHASSDAGRSRWSARRSVDGMFVGEPEDGLARARRARLARRTVETIPSLTFRRDGRIVPHRAHGSFTGFLDGAVSGVGPARPRQVPAAARQPAVRHRRDVARLPVLVRLLRRADPSGPQVPREERRRRSSTRSSAATASSASSSSISGATRSR